MTFYAIASEQGNMVSDRVYDMYNYPADRTASLRDTARGLSTSGCVPTEDSLSRKSKCIQSFSELIANTTPQNMSQVQTGRLVQCRMTIAEICGGSIRT